MDRLHQSFPTFGICRSRLFYFPVLFTTILILSNASTAGAASDSEYPSHAEFVRGCLDSVAQQILGELPFQRSKPIRLTVAGFHATDSIIVELLSGMLAERGYLIRSDSESADTLTEWRLMLDFTQIALRLRDPARRSFLGRIWLERVVAVDVSAKIIAPDDQLENWNYRVARTFSDWIPKRAIKEFNDPPIDFYQPVAPATMLERLRAPLIVGAAAGVGLAAWILIR